MQIQRLASDDWPRFKQLRLAALQDSPDAFGSTLADAQTRSADAWRQQVAEVATFIAVHNEVDAGLVRGAADETDVSTAWLISMWVAPDHRRLGLGARLIDSVVKWARTEGYQRLALDVADHNTPAVQLYSRHGFKSTGETGTLPPPRTHISEHRMALIL